MISRTERSTFDKIRELLSPHENYSRYRRRLKRSSSPLIPFLGVHLGDLIYLSEAKQSEFSKNELEAARQRDSQIGRLIDQLLTFQSKCNYEFDDVPPVKALLVQSRFISELQTLLEDNLYNLSYQIEPRKTKDPSTATSTTSTPTTESITQIKTDVEGLNNDILSLSIDQYVRSLSFDQVAVASKVSVKSEMGSPTQGSSATSPVQTRKVDKGKHSWSLGQKRGIKILKQSTAIEEDTATTERWIKDEVLINMSYSYEAPNGFADESNSSSSMERTRSTSAASSANARELSEFFSNKHVIKEALMTVKIKRDANGKKPAKKVWMDFWVRLFSGMLIMLPKQPLSYSDRHAKVFLNHLRKLI
jgi:hypothetical protein